MSFICPVISLTCQVVDAVPVSSGLSVERLKQLLPCSSCHGGESKALALSGLRLGSHERRILLAAAEVDHNHRVVPPHASGRSAAEAHRRAQRKLGGAGLLSLKQVITGNGSLRRRTGVRLTPLGQAVVERVGEELAEGTPIRWHQHQPALASDVRQPFEELVASFEEAVGDYRRTMMF
ncbi:MAG: hypothetical protein HQL73_14025 [Magnetococcales bacterium]|nr:hypothetical protein [Magnetococcales bacterium]